MQIRCYLICGIFLKRKYILELRFSQRVNMMSTIFWDTAPRSWVGVHERFGGRTAPSSGPKRKQSKNQAADRFSPRIYYVFLPFFFRLLHLLFLSLFFISSSPRLTPSPLLSSSGALFFFFFFFCDLTFAIACSMRSENIQLFV